MLAQGAQRCGRCPMPGHIPDEVGQGSKPADLVEDVPANCRHLGLDGF